MAIELSGGADEQTLLSGQFQQRVDVDQTQEVGFKPGDRLKCGLGSL